MEFGKVGIDMVKVWGIVEGNRNMNVVMKLIFLNSEYKLI